jgi:serine/threonine protein kinase
MAEVYKAYHPGLDRYVAIKVLHSFLAKDENFLTRFQREARVVATFRHPNIVRVHDFDIDAEDAVYYMVMELIDGPNLKTRLEEMARNGQTLSLDEMAQIVVAVARALEYAHKHGMVHRDVKPANVMFTKDGQVVLTDFGISRMVNTKTLTASGAMVGTPAYMAPEQGVGQTGDERADIYSLGVVLYQLLTGKLPFEADTPLGIILQHINAPLMPPTAINPNLPPSIEAVVMRALAKDPNSRYQTAGEFAADLERCMADEPVELTTPVHVLSPVTSEVTMTPGERYQATPWRLPTVQGSATPSPQPAAVVRPPWVWMAAVTLVLALILIAIVILLVADRPRRLLATLFSPETTPKPSLVGTPTLSPAPDLTATYELNATQFAAWMATYEATTGVTPTPSPTMSPTPVSTPTPDLTATALAACVFDMEVVNDYTVWPIVLVPGQRFTKRWVIENTGSCAWPEGLHLAFVSGQELDLVEEPQIEPLSPDETTEVRVTLRAPATYDRHISVWRLEDVAGNPIGEDLEIDCRVGPTQTPRPSATPTATPAPEVTPTPSEALWMSVPGLAWCTGGQADGRIEWGRGGGPSDKYRYFFGTVAPESELSGPYHSFSGFPHVMSYFTVSGPLSWPVPSDCCLGDYGRYVSPEGYEIVWHKVYYAEHDCP